MAYDEKLAERVREVFAPREGLREKKMFGGLAFMLHGHMCCGIAREALMVRVGPEAYEETLARPHARPMDFTGRALKGMVYVDAGGYRSKKALRQWVERGVAFVSSLPPK